MKTHALCLARLSLLVMFACGLQSCVVTPQAPAKKPRLVIEFLDTMSGTAAQFEKLRQDVRAVDARTEGKSLLASVKVWQAALASNRYAMFGSAVTAHYGIRSFIVGKGYPIPDWVYTESEEPVPASQPVGKPALRGGRAEFEKELEKIQREGGGMTEMSITYPDGSRRDFPKR